MSNNKVWARPLDQMDVWLDTQGLFRKHTARDGTCLFRTVSEQVFLSQIYHNEVRKQTMEYILKNSSTFQKEVKCPIDEYVEHMRTDREWGGPLEIKAMALLYKRDFLLYQEIGKPAVNATKNGFHDKILLCYSQDRHYDSVYTKEYICKAAFCQSIVYEVVYKSVFELKEVGYAVKKMLHDKASRYQRDQMSLFKIGFEMRDSYLNVKDLLDVGITPFPYKVAKSLDPDIYRNVEYDTWNEYRKGLRYGLCAWNCRELQVGVKCLVRHKDSTVYHGHIQEMRPNKGPVVVFIEELGEKMTVAYDSLELLPPAPAPTPPTPVRSSFSLKLPLSQPLPKTGSSKEVKSVCNHQTKVKDTNDNAKVPKYSKDFTRDISSSDGSANPRQALKDPVSSPTSPLTDSLSEFYNDGDISQEPIETHSQQNYNAEALMGEQCKNNDQLCVPDSTTGAVVDSANGAHSAFDSCHYQQYSHQTAIAGTPTQPITHPSSLSFAAPDTTGAFHSQAVNFMASKSRNIDGSDLPHSDIPTLRFFYNLGLDHMRMSCVLRPGPIYYPASPSLVSPGYMTLDGSPMAHYDPNIPPGGIDQRRFDYFPHPVIVSPTDSDSAQNAPRLKTKARTNVGAKRVNCQYEGSALVQQCEVTSTNSEIGGTPQGALMPPVYYPQVECDPSYCVPVSYVDYGIYDYPAIYQTPGGHPFSSSSFVAPAEALYYPHVPTGVNPVSTNMQSPSKHVIFPSSPWPL